MEPSKLITAGEKHRYNMQFVKVNIEYKCLLRLYDFVLYCMVCKHQVVTQVTFCACGFWNQTDLLLMVSSLCDWSWFEFHVCSNCVLNYCFILCHLYTRWVIITGPLSAKWQNFAKCGPICVIFSPLNSERICHLPWNLLPHYLVKSKW